MRFIFIFILSFSASVTLAQDSISVKKLFLENNGKDLARFFHTTVDLNIPQSKATYSKKQASIIIGDFIKEHPFTSYTVKHTGGGNGRSNYEIGELFSNERKYRTYLLYNKSEDTFQIIELRIEKE